MDTEIDRLTVKTDKLSAEELTTIAKHEKLGQTYLEISNYPLASDLAGNHHSANMYSPTEYQALKAADMWDAMVNPRPYREMKALSRGVAMSIMENDYKGTKGTPAFNKKVWDAFLEAVE